ncbi:cytochrome P450 [Pyrenochaeta sp. MPI-SDFR-AT-0127]|nr:cytochrome P450 [Pyrenochaeta sp. MPI-SDFR-AT-0127]
MPYGAEWRKQRKIYQSILNINAVTSLQPIQAAKATLTLQQLMQAPEKYYDSIRRYSTAVILSSVFGIRGPEFDHPNIQRLYHVQDQFTAIMETGAAPPVDVFPLLKLLPTFLAPWRKWALSIRAHQRQLYFELIQIVKNRMSNGISRNCFMDVLLEEHQRTKNGLDDEHIAYIGGVLMEGGSDTTASTLLSFLLAMVKYPRVLCKAQEEVDRICGSDKSPTFKDVEQMAYIKHCITEVYDVYGNYAFSKGTAFLANTWAIHHDPEYYDAPEEFRPERYESNEFGYREKSKAFDGVRKTYGFGAGRRICPGQHLAENSLIINISKLVWAFNITPGIDPVSGAQLSKEQVSDSIETAWTNGVLTAPKPFPVTLSVRSKKHQETIHRENEEAHQVFQEYED